jgi:hypothetical protein
VEGEVDVAARHIIFTYSRRGSEGGQEGVGRGSGGGREGVRRGS